VLGPLKIFFTIFLVGGIFSAKAAEIPEYFQSVRSLGMGGVYTYDRVNAGVIFKNPAGLERVKGLNLSIFDLGVGAGGGPSAVSTVNAFSSIGSVSGLSSFNGIYGKPVWVGLGGYTALALPYFGAAVFDEASLGMRVDNPAYTNLNLNFYNDYGFQIGGAFGIGAISVGVALKRVTRRGGNKNIGGSSLANVTNSSLATQFEDEGYGFGADTGILFAPPVPMNPILSIAWQDVGATSFIQTKGTAAPPRIESNLNMGLTFGGDIPLLGFRGGLEYRHIGDSSEVLGKKIHVGGEVTIAMFDIRGGLYQGYPTYGVGVDLFIMQLDAAYYKIERGAYPGQTPDERVQVGLSMNFDFDPNLNLSDTNGKRRRLKQRR
jgi:hypothetical protein